MWTLLVICLLLICNSSSTSLSNHREAFDGNGVLSLEYIVEPDQDRDSDSDRERRLQYKPFSPAQCDLSLFTQWKDSAYQGVLINDPQFWRYQTQLQFVLSKGLALELAIAKCLNRFKLLQNFKAGKGGPIDIQNVWKAMCTSECMQSDIMHEDAMDTTGCTCVELSTNSSSPSFRQEGDWCNHNSAKMLCDKLGFCGRWGCATDDFMCPRYEWNKKFIPLKGFGHCDRKGTNSASRAGGWGANSGALLAAAVVSISAVLCLQV